jgi:hypothetical protein
MSNKDKERKENVHAAASDKDCEDMGKKYGWELIEVRDNGDKILPKDCVFEGEQNIIRGYTLWRLKFTTI